MRWWVLRREPEGDPVVRTVPSGTVLVRVRSGCSVRRQPPSCAQWWCLLQSGRRLASGSVLRRRIWSLGSAGSYSGSKTLSHDSTMELAELVQDILKRPGPVRLIAVDGPGGSGKDFRRPTFCRVGRCTDRSHRRLRVGRQSDRLVAAPPRGGHRAVGRWKACGLPTLRLGNGIASRMADGRSVTDRHHRGGVVGSPGVVPSSPLRHLD